MTSPATPRNDAALRYSPEMAAAFMDMADATFEAPHLVRVPVLPGPSPTTMTSAFTT